MRQKKQVIKNLLILYKSILMKHNNCFLILSFIWVLNIYSMEKPEKIDSTPTNVIANILLGQEKFNPDKLSLPPEIQYKVFNLLFSNIHAPTLTIAARTINTLAQVNKELYNLINNSQFCLRSEERR